MAEEAGRRGQRGRAAARGRDRQGDARGRGDPRRASCSRSSTRRGTVVTAGEVIGWIGEPGEEIPVDRGRARRGRARDSRRPARAGRAGRLAERGRAGARHSGGAGARPGARARDQPDSGQRAGRAGRAGGRARGDRAAGARGRAVPAHRQAIAARLTRAAAVPQFSLATTVDLSAGPRRAGGERGRQP